MQKWLDDNDTLMYSAHNGVKSRMVEMFVRNLKGKTYKKLTVNDSKMYLGHLNNLVDENNNTCHHSIEKKSFDADYFAFTEEIETKPKALKFKVGYKARITKYKNVFSKGYTVNWSKEISFINSALKINPWTYKIKDLNGEKIIGSSYEKELSLGNI